MKVSLTVVKGKPEGLVIPITGAQFLIGRDKRCHLRPNKETVSLLHCAIKIEPTQVLLADLKSTNGTFVNDRRVEGKAALKNGDLLRIGDLAFRVTIELPVSASTNTSAGGDEVLDWLSEADDEPREPGAIIGDDQKEPALDNTTPDLKLEGETQELLARAAPPAAEAPNAKSQSKKDEPKKDEPRYVSPLRPARPQTDMKGTSAAADELLKSYLVRKREPQK
jgi:pSer/pThr/pTyr-binding forkhead associated (FHA) protein